jgi:hypothetical protein
MDVSVNREGQTLKKARIWSSRDSISPSFLQAYDFFLEDPHRRSVASVAPAPLLATRDGRAALPRPCLFIAPPRRGRVAAVGDAVARESSRNGG